jgi:hypothetical protein
MQKLRRRRKKNQKNGVLSERCLATFGQSVQNAWLPFILSLHRSIARKCYARSLRSYA